MLDSNGYIKLADFGLAKIVSVQEGREPNSFCGTPEYLAPEMIVGSGHDHTLALHVLAEAQKAGGTVAFVDAEHALDPVYARKLGVDIDELIGPPETEKSNSARTRSQTRR